MKLPSRQRKKRTFLQAGTAGGVVDEDSDAENRGNCKRGVARKPRSKAKTGRKSTQDSDSDSYEEEKEEEEEEEEDTEANPQSQSRCHDTSRFQIKSAGDTKKFVMPTKFSTDPEHNFSHEHKGSANVKPKDELRRGDKAKITQVVDKIDNLPDEYPVSDDEPYDMELATQALSNISINGSVYCEETSPCTKCGKHPCFTLVKPLVSLGRGKHPPTHCRACAAEEASTGTVFLDHPASCDCGEERHTRGVGRLERFKMCAKCYKSQKCKNFDECENCRYQHFALCTECMEKKPCVKDGCEETRVARKIKGAMTISDKCLDCLIKHRTGKPCKTDGCPNPRSSNSQHGVFCHECHDKRRRAKLSKNTKGTECPRCGLDYKEGWVGRGSYKPKGRGSKEAHGACNRENCARKCQKFVEGKFVCEKPRPKKGNGDFSSRYCKACTLEGWTNAA